MTGLIGIVLLLVLNLAISETNISRLVENEQRVIEVHADLAVLQELVAKLREAESAERGFLITGDPEFLKSYESAAARTVATLEHLQLRAANDQAQRPQLAPLRQAIQARLRELQTTVVARNSGGFEAARKCVATNQGPRLMAGIRNLVNDVRQDEGAILAQRAADSRRSFYMAAGTNVVGAAIGIGLVGLAFALFRRDFLLQRRADETSCRLAAIVESSDDAIIGETIEGVITSWNSGATEIFGFKADEMVGQSTQKLIPPPWAAAGGENPMLSSPEMRVDQYETKRMTKDGRVIDLSLKASSIKDRAGEIIGIAWIARDITVEKSLQRAVLDIASQEQRRIGQDLHDGTGQQLTGLAMMSQRLVTLLDEKSAPELRIAERVADGIADVLQGVRTLSRGLVPVQLDRQGLMAALADLAASTSEMHDIICTFQCDEPVCIPNNDVATNLYRMSQEAVTNAIKHGSAKNIVISLVVDGNRVTLKVADDGVGLKVLQDPTASGLGLRIMRYRAQLIDAKLYVAPNHPSGTQVSCCFLCKRMPDGSCEPVDYVYSRFGNQLPVQNCCPTEPQAESEVAARLRTA